MWPRHPIQRVRHRLLTDHFASTVVVPGSIAHLRPLGAWLLENVHRLAERLCIPPIAVAGWHAGADPYEIVGAHHRLLERKTCLVANVRFLLLHAPPAWDLMQRASQERRPVLYGSRASGELYAVAFRPSRLRRLDLERLLADLTRCDDARGDGWATTPGAIVVDEASDPTARARPDAYGARRLNTALREVIERPSEDGVDGEDPDHLARVLVAQRDRSAVPWIWNALANEVEHRAARPRLRSFPQEMHLSLTGRCNIECRFCSYSHEAARSDFVDRARLEGLGVLRHLRTVRLSSGLGEPTIHPHLAGIVAWLADRLPHLELNFFTNGIRLDRADLRAALVGRLAWVNVSLNAATRAGWSSVCSGDHFDRVCQSLRALTATKHERGLREPLVRGSIVLTAANLEELPRMPELCRELGVVYLTAIPFFSLGYDRLPRLSGKDTLHAYRARYDELYDSVVAAARAAGLSIELPLPSDGRATRFGLEVRRQYDFAGVEQHRPVLGRLLDGDPNRNDTGVPCPELWRNIYLGSTARLHARQEVTHYAYPCLGPLSSVDLSEETGFDFPVAEADFLEFWNNPLHRHLREAQSRRGTCAVCDVCRSTDTRDPAEFPRMEELIATWQDTRNVARFVRPGAGSPDALPASRP
jgi:MoaA/NifB/PqqE/SkfB family radical SAM enzyme